MATETISVMEDIYSENHKIAAKVQSDLTGRNVLTVNILGAPGAGKTTTLTQIIQRLDSPVMVIEGDVESDIDTVKLQSMGIPAFQINTAGGCHLDAPMIAKALGSIELKNNSYLFIENIGNLICPAEFDIGEHIKLIICSVADGSDKPYKYPLAFEKAKAVIVNKSDLLPYVDFDKEYFTKGVRNHNPNAEVFFVSGKTGEGFDQLTVFLKQLKKSVA